MKQQSKFHMSLICSTQWIVTSFLLVAEYLFVFWFGFVPKTKFNFRQCQPRELMLESSTLHTRLSIILFLKQ